VDGCGDVFANTLEILVGVAFLRDGQLPIQYGFTNVCRQQKSTGTTKKTIPFCFSEFCTNQRFAT
jgi:hypothetical protein